MILGHEILINQKNFMKNIAKYQTDLKTYENDSVCEMKKTTNNIICVVAKHKGFTVVRVLQVHGFAAKTGFDTSISSMHM